MTRSTLASSIAAALLLAACGGTHHAQAPPASTQSAAVNVVTTSATDSAFLSYLRPYFPGTTDAVLVKLGHVTCDGLHNGLSSHLVEGSLMQNTGMDEALASLFVGASEGAYCPQIPADQ